MKIVHLYKDYYPVLGGIENHVRVLAGAQVRAGHQVSVLVTSTSRRTERYEMNGVSVIKAARLAAPASTPLSLAFIRAAASLKADIAHLHFPYPPGELVNYLFKVGKRTVITYHSDVVRQKTLVRLYRPLLLRVLKRADRILPTSRAYLDTSPYLQAVRERCSVVPLGVEVVRFASLTPAEVAPLRNRLGIPQEALILLFVGRLRHYKGVDILLQALTMMETTHLVIVGEGPMKAEWETLSARLGLQPRVSFADEVGDELLPRYYALADIFVLPATSRAEAFGTVILEAMAAGKPVISTEVGTGTSWVNQDGVTGLVVPPRDAEALARAIDRLHRDPETRRKMGVRAHKRAVDEFSQERMIAQVEAIYHEVLMR
ncbi:MAG: glycosyltransferase [Anaerolineales bacterium]|nr:glycosyltransferase [Anaerolineales bacterium]